MNWLHAKDKNEKAKSEKPWNRSMNVQKQYVYVYVVEVLVLNGGHMVIFNQQAFVN